MIPGYLVDAGPYLDVAVGVALVLLFAWAVKPARS